MDVILFCKYALCSRWTFGLFPLSGCQVYAAVNILLWVCWWTCGVRACAGVNAEVAVSSFRSFCQEVFQGVVAVFILTSNVCSPRCPVSLPTLDIVCLFHFSLSCVLWFQEMLIAFPWWLMMLSYACWLFEYSLLRTIQISVSFFS